MTDETAADSGFPGAEDDASPEALLRRLTQPDRLIVNDWWRCLRRGGISGRYGGLSTNGSSQIDLRVDVDPRYPNSPVLDRVSADVFAHYKFQWWGRTFEWSVYLHSWVVDSPSVQWRTCSAVVSGTARRYDTGATFPVEVTVTWASGQMTGATCVIDPSGANRIFNCTYDSKHFRDLTLEVDVAASVNNEPIEPSYDVTWHPNRPSGIPQRVLTVEESYREAGIDVTVNEPADRTIIDDSNSQFTTWTDDELHDAMEQHFSLYGGGWPAWKMWFLVCGSYTSSGTGGIMFDYSGPGEPPERQGCAIFRNHRWWNQLVNGTPGTSTQAAAHRKWLHTWIHEIGHGLNYVHSWNKGAPDDLSWMNYDWRYDNRNGSNSYFANFMFRFSDDELIHLRHGNRREVIPGGDAWATGMHADDQLIGADATVEGVAPIEVLVRSKQSFEFMEPVKVEVRLRNATGDADGRGIDIDVDTNLSPEDGSLTFLIRRPDGRTISYHPPMCRFGTDPDLERLAAPGGVKGQDRRSAEFALGLGADGFYFDEPGTYLVRAVWHSGLGVSLPSDVHRVRVGRPADTRIEGLGTDFFSRQAGLAMYFGGSASTHLEKGMDAIRSVIEELPAGGAKAQIASTVAPTFTAQRFRVNKKGKVVRSRAAEPETALQLMNTALEQQASDPTTFTNLGEHHLQRERATVMAATGKKTQAKRDLGKLATALSRRGVNQPVIDDLKEFTKQL